MYNPDADVHILDRLAVLYRYRRIAIAVFVLTTAAMMIQGYTNEKIYRAQARLLIEDERAAAVPGVSPDNFYEDPDLYYKTQYRILRGRDLTRRVVRKLNLGSVPEFNGTAEQPSTPATMLGVGGRSSRTTATASSTSGCSASALSISPSSMRKPRTFTCWSTRPRKSIVPSGSQRARSPVR